MDAKGRPKHVELLTPNKEHKKLHFVGIYMISITKMHGPMNIKENGWGGFWLASFLQTEDSRLRGLRVTSPIIILAGLATDYLRISLNEDHKIFPKPRSDGRFRKN